MKNEVLDMDVEDVIRRLISNRDDTFFVNTTVKVISVERGIKEGDRWSLGYITAGNIKDREKVKMEFRVNLWGNFSPLVNELAEGDILNIRRGLAKNFSFGDRVFPQISCDERYGSEVEIEYERERIVVDGTNVAWMTKKEGKPNIDNIEMVRRELEKEGYAPIIIVDASLRHNVPESDKERFEKWIEEGKVIQAPAQVRADDAILKFANDRGLRIVSNDTFRDYEEVYPWVKDKSKRIPFNIIGTQAILYFR
jgi:NOL1/NOP2/fmu family ribosome biogenesis protein